MKEDHPCSPLHSMHLKIRSLNATPLLHHLQVRHHTLERERGLPSQKERPVCLQALGALKWNMDPCLICNRRKMKSCILWGMRMILQVACVIKMMMSSEMQQVWRKTRNSQRSSTLNSTVTHPGPSPRWESLPRSSVWRSLRSTSGTGTAAKLYASASKNLWGKSMPPFSKLPEKRHRILSLSSVLDLWRENLRASPALKSLHQPQSNRHHSSSQSNRLFLPSKFLGRQPLANSLQKRSASKSSK